MKRLIVVRHGFYNHTLTIVNAPLVPMCAVITTIYKPLSVCVRCFWKDTYWSRLPPLAKRQHKGS